MTFQKKIWIFILSGLMGGCASLPEPSITPYAFPKENVYIDQPVRKYESLGSVRSKVNYPSLNMNWSEKRLCENHYNKSVRDLLKYAKKAGADAVMMIRSVVFLVDGRKELYRSPECSDDGEEGQILTQGIAIRWKKDQEK
ncbi:MAG: hypothetical protein CL678_13015 [Bdellovibrionaceae bacterium]|nr:hypothetical protein [Pseudobdellovibrionaceae bacterium]